jgi:hypothetical protein
MAEVYRNKKLIRSAVLFEWVVCAAIYSDTGDTCAGFTGMVELTLTYDSS